MPVVIRDYPKWIELDGEQFLVKDEDHMAEIDNQVEKDFMVEDLEENYGKKVDLRSYKGPVGFGSLKAYYEATVANASSEDD